MSPFSAKVFLKKTFIKNVNGNPFKIEISHEPTYDQIKAKHELLPKKIFHLESSSLYLSSLYEQTLLNYHQTYQTNEKLLTKLLSLHAKLSAFEVENLKFKKLQEQINIKEDKIQLELKKNNEKLIKQVQRFNSELSESKAKTSKEVEEILKRSK